MASLSQAPALPLPGIPTAGLFASLSAPFRVAASHHPGPSVGLGAQVVTLGVLYVSADGHLPWGQPGGRARHWAGQPLLETQAVPGRASHGLGVIAVWWSPHSSTPPRQPHYPLQDRTLQGPPWSGAVIGHVRFCFFKRIKLVVVSHACISAA